MIRSIFCLFVVLVAAWWSVPAPLLAADDTVCIQCHSGQEGHLAAPVADWRTSIHAANGISCNDCHGGDPTDFAMAMSPERGFIGAPEYTEVPDFCGRCHVGVAKEYKAGAHGKAINNGGAQCVVCHGNHAIQRASLDLINEESCTRCHTYERAALIKMSLVETDTIIKKVENNLNRLYRLGFNVEDMKGEVFNQRNRFHRIFHGVDVERVRQETAGVQGQLDKILKQINAIDTTIGERKLWGSIVLGLFILVGITFLLLRKAYEDEEKE
ncbi:MAG: cytochrome c3 family protein [Desulfuromonadales bacterium]